MALAMMNAAIKMINRIAQIFRNRRFMNSSDFGNEDNDSFVLTPALKALFIASKLSRLTC